MSIFDEALNRIERGRLGLNKGLPHGFPRLAEYIPNIQQGTYYLIGAEQKVGKTSFADCAFMYNPYDWLADPDTQTDIKLKIIYFSLEVEKVIKITKGICRSIYRKHKILVDVNYVLSRGKHRCSDEIYELVKKEREHFEGLEDILDVIDERINPTGMAIYLKKYAEQNGKFEQIDEYKRKYVPNNPNLYTLVVVDHIALVKGEKNLYSVKEKIDKTSEYLMEYRNMCNFSPVVISQFNRSLATAERELAISKGTPNYDKIKPQLGDFKDSGNTQADANVIFGLFNPNRYDIPNYMGYNINPNDGGLAGRIRTLHVLATRDGEGDISLGLGYIGETGDFQELPRPNDMITKERDVYKILNNIKKHE